MTWWRKADALEAQGKYEQAIQAYDKALEYWDWNNVNYPDCQDTDWEGHYKKYWCNASLWCSKASAFRNLGREFDAIAASNRAKELGLDCPEEQMTTSKSTSETSTSYRPNSDEWTSKGISFIQQGKFEDAIACFDKAAELAPMSKEAWGFIGFALLLEGEYDKSIPACDKAIGLDPKNPNYWVVKGAALFYQSKYDDANNCFEEATSLGSTDSIMWCLKGWTLQKLGRDSDAKAAFDKAGELGRVCTEKPPTITELARET